MRANFKWMLNITLSFFYYIILIIVYQKYISPIYNGLPYLGKYGYPAGHFSVDFFIISLLIMVLFSFFIPTKVSFPSEMLVVVYYYLVFIPYCSLFSLSLTHSADIYFLDYLSFFIFFSSYKYYYKYILHRERCEFRLRNCTWILFKAKKWPFIVGVLSIIFLFPYSFNAIKYLISNPYYQRHIFDSYPLWAYFVVSFIFFGLALYYLYIGFILNKKRFLFLSASITIEVFLITYSKLMIFSFLLIVILFSLCHKRIKNCHFNVHRFLITMIFILVLSPLFLALLSFIRRALYLPAQISYLYFYYFSYNAYNLLAKYTHIIFNIYTKSAPYIIGSKYFLPTTHANSGIVPDSYANFGLLGVIIYSILFLVIAYLIDGLKLHYPNIHILFLVHGISLTNSSLLSVFLFQILPTILIFRLNETRRFRFESSKHCGSKATIY